MPLPWKKKPRSARISGLLADLQSPPKRGGSLVVETGFPTSLIDLFVKNRDRLKKSPKRSKQSNRRGRHPDAGDSAIHPPIADPRPADHADPPPLPAPRDRFREDGAGAAAELPCTGKWARGIESEDEDVGEGGRPAPTAGGIPDEKSLEYRPRADRVPPAVLAVFAVAALALCTKVLAVGITIPALVLLFLEHVGVVIPRLQKHCSNSGRDAGPPNSRYKRRQFVFEGTEKEVIEDGETKTTEGGSGAVVHGQELDSVGPDPEPEELTLDRRSGWLDAEEETGPGSQGSKKKPKVLKRIAMRKKSRNPKKRETVESRSKEITEKAVNRADKLLEDEVEVEL